MKLRTHVQDMIAKADSLMKDVDGLKGIATEDERKTLAKVRQAAYNVSAPLRLWENKMTDERGETSVTTA